MGGIALEGVSKVFPGDVVAVDDVDLQIGEGEFIVLVGPSGCGKSTLLRMIAGLEDVDTGAISSETSFTATTPANSLRTWSSVMAAIALAADGIDLDHPRQDGKTGIDHAATLPIDSRG